MKIESTEIQDTVLDLQPLTYIMERNGFVLAGQWDYERVTFDHKINSPEKNITYYIRVSGYAVEGDVDTGKAVIKLLTPLLGKHHYPHGVEYGEGEEIPQNITEKTERILNNVNDQLKQFIAEEAN
ncbi:YugN family protein [Aquisalibacillus elongatus]|uniref:YugN-like protein n=1 Tax=Aquisalibacillus elongatus TaxID=485577 RepID=A0A3N5C1Z8_9BACI|nr:YugN family protein [Aquisalibacillus elongatus]RPF56108.1 YugN-like protein [Aquisalibacillus elongatus]